MDAIISMENPLIAPQSSTSA